MALTKRIIPCLDIKNGKTVKGINFENIRNVGDPVELAALYSEQGADELVFLDITATNEKRKTLVDLVQRVAAQINIPFTVGGGISAIEDVEVLLNSGADKVSINSAAIKNRKLIYDLSTRFGSQCIVIAADVKLIENEWYVFINSGTVNTGLKALDWLKECYNNGAGEILLTSMNNDGVKKGFANDITSLISKNIPLPIIASGGAGTMEHFKDAFTIGNADGALAASVFHYQEITIPDLKTYLKNNNINVRLS